MKRLLALLIALCLPAAAHATVTTLYNSVSFSCTGSTGPYPFTFPISDPTAMTVMQNGIPVSSTAYTIAPVNNNYNNGGSVTLLAACPSGGTLLLLKRVTPLTQTQVFADNMPVPMKSFENGLDKLTEIAQDQQAVLNLGIVSSITPGTNTSCTPFIGGSCTGNVTISAAASGGTMVYPPAGFGVSTGSAWSSTPLIGGSVSNIYLASGGSGGCPNAVTFTGGGSPTVAATATFQCDDSTVFDLVLTNSGYGYTSTPTITFTGSPGTEPIAFAQMPYVPSPTVNGQVLTVQDGIPAWEPPSGSTSVGGSVAGVAITSQGSYTSCPTLTFSGGNPTIPATGSIFCSSEGGFTVPIAAILSDAGYGYTGTPTVSVTGGTGGGATAVAEMGSFVIALTTVPGASNASLEDGILNIPPSTGNCSGSSLTTGYIPEVTAPCALSNSPFFDYSGSVYTNGAILAGDYTALTPPNGFCLGANEFTPELDCLTQYHAGGNFTLGANVDDAGAIFNSAWSAASVRLIVDTSNPSSVTINTATAIGAIPTTVATFTNALNTSHAPFAIDGISDGCAEFTSNVLGSTGTACGPGGGGSVLTSPSASQTVTQPGGTSLAINGGNTTSLSSQSLITSQFFSYSPGWSNGESLNGSSDWSVIKNFATNMMSATAGISQMGGCLLTHTAKGDSACNYDYLTAFGGNTAYNDEAITHNVLHTNQLGYFYGPVTSGGTGVTSITVTGPSCSGDCSQLAFNSSQFAVGGLMFDQTQPTGPLTLGALAATGTGGLEAYMYTLSSGTVTPSSAVGVVSSCSASSLQGRYGVYGSQTCTVTLTSGSFSTGAGNVFSNGNFPEESAITAAGTATSTQSITLTSQFPLVAGNLVMQGGPGGESLTLTGVSWPVAYWIVGALDSTHLLFSNCLTGTCYNNLGSNLIPAAVATSTVVLTRNGSGTVTAGPNPFVIGSIYSFVIGNSLIVSGCTVHTDLNGTFTVATNSYDATTANAAITWAQSGSSETDSTCTISLPPHQITLYPSTWINGTNGGTIGTAQLATNHITFSTADVAIGAPAAQVQMAGLNVYQGQTTPSNGSNTSHGVSVSDVGPAQMNHAYSAGNNPSNGVAFDMFHAAGSYGIYFNFAYRPGNNGTIINVGGTEPVSSNPKPYFIFQDQQNSSSKFGFNPLLGQFSMTGQLVLPSIIAMNAASQLATGTTINGKLPCLADGTNCPTGGTVTSVSVTTANGISGSVATASTTPAITLTLGAITPSSVASAGAISGTTGTFTGGISIGSSSPTACVGLSGCGAFAEAGTTAAVAAGVDTMRADTSHLFKVSLNGVAEFVSLMNFSTVNLASSAAGGVTGNLPLAQVPGAAPLASPALTGVPTAPTAALGTNTTQIATTAFVAASTYLSGTTGSIGGSLLAGAGSCVTGTATVTGVGAGNFPVGSPVAVSASDGSLPNGLVTLSAAASATNTVTVSICAIAAVTPTAKTYNVSVF